MTKDQGAQGLYPALLKCRRAFGAAFLFGFFINGLMLVVSIYSMQVFDRVLGSGSLDTLLMLSLVSIFSIVFIGIFQFIRSLVLSHVAHWFEHALAHSLAYQTVDIAFFKPELGAQPLRDLGTIKGFLNSQGLCLAFDAPWAVVYFIVLYVINIWIGVLVTGCALVLLGLHFLSERICKKPYAQSQESQVLSFQAFDCIVNNSEIIRSMGFQNQALEKWRSRAEEAARDQFQSLTRMTAFSTVSKNLRLTIQMGLTGISAWLVLKGILSPGAIIGVAMIAGKALQPFDALPAICQGWLGALKAYGRLVEVEKASEQTAEHRIALPEPKGQVCVEKVAYQAGGVWILKGVSFALEPGESLAIIGPSGSGKTTLARLLTGVLRPTSGAIRLDGADLSQWDPAQLGKYVGYLPQDVELFEGSVAENIARLDHGAEDQDIIAAAQASYAHEEILRWSAGYQTEVGRYGALLSAGQKQRVGLARAFFGPVCLAILDEPNAHLDTGGEEAFVRTLVAAKERGITTISIVHRPSILNRVDKIAVLRQGEIALFGPAQEVLQKMRESAPAVPARRQA